LIGCPNQSQSVMQLKNFSSFILIAVGLLILLLSFGTFCWSIVSLYLSFTTPKNSEEQGTTELASFPTWIFFVSIAGFLTAFGFIGASISAPIPNPSNSEESEPKEEKPQVVVEGNNVYDNETVRVGVEEVYYDRKSYQEI
jgi:hypothetical protein